MFYVEDKIIQYPFKRIIDDVLSRDGEPTKDSFTCYWGMRNLIDKQGLRDSHYTLQELVADRPDFSLVKLVKKDSQSLDDTDIDVRDYSNHLENIDESLVEGYVTQVLIGFKLNNSGRKAIEAEEQTITYIPNIGDDDDDNDYVNPTDLVEVDVNATLDDISDAKQKVPYYLKVLWDGSIQKGGLLLSFIIARCKYGGGKLTPRDCCSCGVYMVDKKGNVVRKFDTTDNTGTKFRSLMAWINGNTPDRFYEAYKQLLACCSILEIDLCKENPLDYTASLMDRAVCTYLQSNTEYVKDYGMLDMNICRRLQDKNELFTVINEVESCGDSGVIEITDGKVKEVDVLALIDILAVNFESFLNRNPELLRNVQDADFGSVKEYLKFTVPALDGNEKLLNSVMQGFTTMHYMLYRNATSSYMIIPNRLLSGTTTDGDDNVWGGLLSVTGHIIVIKETVLHTEIPYIMYCSVKEFIDANKGHRDITWRYADI